MTTSEALDALIARQESARPAPVQERATWAMAGDALRFLSDAVAALRPQRSLELGSGQSTCAIAAALTCDASPGTFQSYDHDPDFVHQTNYWLAATGLSGVVTVEVAPLVLRKLAKGGQLLPVYRTPTALGRMDLVLVDGPPSHVGGRLGSLVQAVSVTAASGVVLLDDANREAEREALSVVEDLHAGSLDIRLVGGLVRGLACIHVREQVDDLFQPPY